MTTNEAQLTRPSATQYSSSPLPAVIGYRLPFPPPGSDIHSNPAVYLAQNRSQYADTAPAPNRRHDWHGYPAGPSTYQDPYRPISPQGPSWSPALIEAIPPPTLKAAYEPPVFRTFQERKRAKEMALTGGLGHSPGPNEVYHQPSQPPYNPTVADFAQHHLPNIPQSSPPPPTPSRSATLPSAAAQTRPLPQPSARTASPLPPIIRTSSLLENSSPFSSPVYSPKQATIERSDTLSSIKSLDRMGFSSSGRRPLPKPPGGVNSSKSLDRGIPTTVFGTGLRRKQPFVVSEEGSEDSLADGMRGMDITSNGNGLRSPARTPVNPPSMNEPSSAEEGSLPTFNFPDPNSADGSEDDPIRHSPPDRTPSPGIAFTGLPVIAVSSEDNGGEIRILVPLNSLPGEIPSRAPTRVQPDTAILCSGCDQTIIGRIVNAMKQRWHPQCFRCDACEELLEHVSSYEYEGRAYCHLDYHDVGEILVRELTAALCTSVSSLQNAYCGCAIRHARRRCPWSTVLSRATLFLLRMW